MMHVIYHIYSFNTYVKIHPYVTIKYFQVVINLLTIATNGTY